jgi:hypothetical protein
VLISKKTDDLYVSDGIRSTRVLKKTNNSLVVFFYGIKSSGFAVPFPPLDERNPTIKLC